MTQLTWPLTIRLATPDDSLALTRLAALDSSEHVPSGSVLLAEVEGELRAALSLRDAAVVSDPFCPTAHIVELLRAHARDSAPARRWHLRRRNRYALA